MTYRCESWLLDVKTRRMINGVNSRLLSHFTGKSVQQEARPATTSLNLVRRLRQLRLRWLGNILRGENTRLIFKAIEAQHAHNMEGGLLMDAPPFNKIQDLIPLAVDREGWSALVRSI